MTHFFASEGDSAVQQFLESSGLPIMQLEYFRRMDYPDPKIPVPREEIDLALRCFRMGVELMPQDHPGRAGNILNLITSLQILDRDYGDKSSREELAKIGVLALDSKYSPPTIRLQAGEIVAAIEVENGNWS